MPKLNHANLPVADVPALRAFLIGHFGFTEVTTRGADAFVVLHGDDGFVLNLMRCRDGERFPENFHVGFVLEDPEAVRAKHAELREAGIDVGDVEALRRGGPGSLTFYCRAPNGGLVEVGSTG